MEATAVLLLSAAIGVGSAQDTGTRHVRLSSLTVPADRLAEACAIAPSETERVDGTRVRAGLWAGLRVETNPWTGSDAQTLATIRGRIGPPLPPPADGPPPSRGELSRYHLRLAEGVEEGYAAVYRVQQSSSVVTVHALRFASPDKAAAARAVHEADSSRRLRVGAGATVAVVSGEGPCFEAVASHVKAMVK